MMKSPCAMLITRMTPKMTARPSEMMRRIATMLNPVRNCAKSASAIHLLPRVGGGERSPTSTVADRQLRLTLIVPDFDPFGTFEKSQSLSGYSTLVHGSGRIQSFDSSTTSDWPSAVPPPNLAQSQV